MEHHFSRLIICHSKRVPAECRYLPILLAYALRTVPCFRIAYPLYTIYPPDQNLVGNDYSGINVPLVAVCNVPPVAQCNVPPQKWLQ